MSRTGTKVCGQCQVRFGDGDCFHMPGQGTEDDPFRPTPVIGADGADSPNLVECGPSGLAAILPPIYRDPPAAHIYSIHEQVVPYNAPWPMVFDKKRYDTDAMWDLDNFPSQIQFKTPGLYLVTFNAVWFRTEDDDATGGVGAYLRVNGSEYLAADSFPTGDSFNFDKHSVSTYFATPAGGYVEAIVYHTVKDGDGEPRNMRIITERSSPNFMAVFIRELTDMDVLGIPESAS